MAKQTVKDAILLCLETKCAGRSLDNEIERALTVSDLTIALADVLYDWLHEALDCAVCCDLDATERIDYAATLTRETLTLSEEDPHVSGR